MSRLIKFRAWASDTKEMLPWEECFSDIWFYEPEEADLVVMQFTGMRDGADKEIYEGDILEVLHPTMFKGVYEVVWLDSDGTHFGCFGLKTGGGLVVNLKNMFGDMMVRGNAYQNPELLPQ